MSEFSSQLIAIASEARQLASRLDEIDETPLEALESSAEEVGRSWSGSSLGYQANVYYKGYQVPPAGARFSREWGFLGQFQGTTGDWEIHNQQDVANYIDQLAGEPDLRPARESAAEVRDQVEDLVQRARSVAARIPGPHDDYLKATLDELQHVSLPSLETLCRIQHNTTSGQMVVRDVSAAEGGWQTAGHQVVLANVMHIRSPYAVAQALAKLCQRLGQHLEGHETSTEVAVIQLGSKVFIGHGGASNEYLKLGVWLTDRGLEWEVFDRVPTAGLSTKERLQQMLDNAQIAFLLMTPEDVDAQGEMTARANVIHEVGLFQGRLGWTKAIILLEDGCAEFSNIEGVGQVRYPRGNIGAAFDEIRNILVREGMLAESEVPQASKNS